MAFNENYKTNSSSMTIKIYRGDDIRRFKMDLSEDPKEGLVSLQNRVVSTFAFESTNDFVLKYKDDEGDLCTVQQPDEFREAVRMVEGSLLRLWTYPAGNQKTASRTTSKSSEERRDEKQHVPEFLDPLLKAFNVSHSDVEKCLKGADCVKMLDVPIASLFENFQKAAQTNSQSGNNGDRCPFRQGHNRCGGFRKRNKGNPIHWGVECDVSGMNPIVGGRYHRMGDNFDLCEAEFQKLEDGEKLKYELIRFPGSQPEKAVTEKLCARFIQDVTVFDGTQVLPGTTFTKIWRLQNVGKTEWPEGTVLERVGGDQMGSTESVNVAKTQPGGSADISIDLTAPENAGRHVGYYRLRGPNGRRFGQRVWVMIHVVSPKNFESNEVADSDLEEFKPEGDDTSGADENRQTKEQEEPQAEKESEQQPEQREEAGLKTDGDYNVDTNDELPGLEGVGDESTLVNSGSSDDFVDVKADDNVLVAKLADICKIKSEEAEEFLTKNDEALVQAMIDNSLLRELRSAVALSIRQETETEPEADTETQDNEDSVGNDSDNRDDDQSVDSNATEYAVGLECLRSMGFEGDHVVLELNKNQGRIEDTVKALLSLV